MGVCACLRAPWAEGMECVEEPAASVASDHSTTRTGGEKGVPAHPPGAPCMHPKLQGAKI